MTHKDDTARALAAIGAMNAARTGPHVTCPSSRHAAMMAEEMVKGGLSRSHMQDLQNCGESLAAVVRALWEARQKIEALEAENARLRAAAHEIARMVREAQNARLRKVIPPLIVVAIDNLAGMDPETRAEVETDIEAARAALRNGEGE